MTFISLKMEGLAYHESVIILSFVTFTQDVRKLIGKSLKRKISQH